MSTAVTWTFGEIFPTLEKWYDFINGYNIDIDLTEPITAEFNKYCYKLLSRYFWDQNIRYSSINAFCRALANVYEDRFKQFKKQYEYLGAAYQVTPEDSAIINEAISNGAENPNTKPLDPWKPLEFISAQTSSRVKSNRLQAYLTALNSVPSLRINEFIRGRRGYEDEIGFTDLFMQVIPHIDYLY